MQIAYKFVSYDKGTVHASDADEKDGGCALNKIHDDGCLKPLCHSFPPTVTSTLDRPNGCATFDHDRSAADQDHIKQIGVIATVSVANWL